MKKRTIIFACALLFAVAAQAQWDLEGVTVDTSKWIDFAPSWNPDPYIMTPGAGSVGSVRQSVKSKGIRRAPQKAEGAELPEYWDNATTKHFPPVFNQSGGSCGVSSRAGYMLCEELNAYRGTDASHPDNRIAPNPQHPFDHTGPNKNTMAEQIGFPSVTVLGGFPFSNAIGFYGPTSDDAGWMQGYDKWYKTMHNRIWGASNVPVGVIGYPEDNSEGWGLGGFGPGAIAAKRWLYNHNGDESFHTGGLLGLGVASGGKVLAIPSTATNREIGLNGKKYWVTGSSVDHAVTMCGYDDRVEFDLDGNGKVGERKNSDGYDERGAWIVVNSWGGWANGGFIYVPYAIAAPRCKSNSSGKGYLPVESGGFTPEMWHIRKDYTPTRTIKLKISFTQRSAISLKAGISTNLNATSPTKELVFEHFNYKGDGNNDGKDAMTPMLGKWKDGMHYEPMEFGFDLSDLQADFDPTQPLKFFFIIESSPKNRPKAVGVGGIHEASIVDYTCDPNGIEIPFVITGDSIVIGNNGKTTKISTIVYGEAINPPTNLRISGTTLSWDAPQTNFTPKGYIIYRDGNEIGRTDGNTKNYNVGTNEGTYTIKTIYEFGGEDKLSAASASVVGNYSVAKRYITKMGTPISKVADLKDGMTVVLYNVGRGKYVCDTGAKNYQHKAAAPKGAPNNDEYVFTVHKEGNTFTFTSNNGSLPAFDANNVGIPVSDTPGKFTVTLANSSEKTFLLKNGSWYLNGNENVPVTWNAGDGNSQHKITPVECDPAIQSVEDYTTVTAENLMDGQLVALYNNGRNYYVAEENGAYVAKTDAPTAQSFNYVFRVGKNADGTFTFTSMSGAIPTLPYNTTFAPGNTAENFTLTSAGTGLFYLQGATAVASEGGKQERQYLNGNETAPVGWNATGANSTYRLYPIKMVASAPSISISSPASVQAYSPVQFKLTGDADIASCVWTIDGKTYTTTSPTVAFTTTGSQTVECTAVNMRGMSTTAKKTITVNAASEISADFTVTKSDIAGGDPVSFLATNQLAGCTYHWDLPGTKVLTANTRNVSVVYLETGEHQVTLTVTAPDGTKKSSTQTVTVHQVPPTPAYNLSDAIILKGQSVNITDQSLYNPTAWSWTLLEERGVRYQSNDQNPTFTPAPGRYELLVTATNEMGSKTVTQKNAVLVCNAPSYTGLEFAGGSNRVTAKLPTGVTNAWTIDFWLNPTTLESASAGFFFANDLSLTANADGAVTLKRGTTALAASKDTYYKVDEWHHYAISYSSGSVVFYRDGVEFSRATCTLKDYTTHFTTLQIGGSDAPMQGMIDEFRIWAKALSIARIRTYAVAPIENMPAAVQNEGLLLYYQFNQNSGNCEDATSYGNIGTRHDFGPEGDAWSDSYGVFALNLENSGSTLGGMLSQNYFRIIDVSDEDGNNLASNIIDGKDDTQWSNTKAYPHGFTLDRGKKDEVRAIRICSSRSNEIEYLPTTINIYESDDASTWTSILTGAHLAFSGNYSEVILPNPTTSRYLKFEFPTGGTNFALNEIFFFGKEGEVFDNQTDITSQTGHTVTWRIFDKSGTELWKIFKQTNVAQGTKAKLPDAYRIKGCTYSTVSATVDGDITVDVRCTWSLFTPSTPDNPVYHNLRVNGDKYLRWDVATGKILLNKTKPATTEETGKWAFFGNPYAGYLVVNAAEPNLYLSCQSPDQSYALLDAVGTRFNSCKSDNANGGFLLQVNQNVSYLNDYANEGQLATWANEKALSGAGSAFIATKVSGSTNGIETIENQDERIRMNANSIFDLSGRKVGNGSSVSGNLPKGIYIINGKKVVVK